MALKRAKIVGKTVNILLNVLIIVFSVVLLISVYTLIQHKIFGNKYTNFFGYSTFEVQSNSMEDTINVGDWIIVKLTKKVKVDDIITYELKGDYITHRVIEAYNGTYITMGDANNAKDDPVDRSQIIGKSVKILRGFGILRKTIFNAPVLLAVIITLFLFNSAMKKDDKKSKLYLKIEEIFFEVIKKIKKSTSNKQKEVIPIEVKEEVLNNNTPELVEEKVDDTPEKIIEEPIINNIPEEEIPELIENNEIIENSEISKEISVENETNEYVEDDLDKTMFHRMITVDLNEVDETLLEIAKTEMAAPVETKVPEKKLEVVEPEIEEEGLTDITLNLIKENSKKSKHLIEELMNFKKEELNEIINTFMDSDKLQSNEATIRNTFISTYINARYYNYYNDKEITNSRNFVTRVEKLMKTVMTDLVSHYKGSDTKYSYKVGMYANIFKIIASLDLAKDNISEIKAKREFYKEEITKCYKDDPRIEVAVNEIIRIQKSYNKIIKYFFERLETNTFFLNLNKITSKKDWYAVSLEHNIVFNKVYSEYIIDKTYTEGIVAEDKLSVLFTLINKELIRDMILCDFDKKYYIYISDSLYKKEKKLIRLLKMIDDEYAKAHVRIVLTAEDLLLNKNCIKNISKLGYKFALALDSNTRISPGVKTNMYMVNTIFVNKKDEDYEKIISYIPKDLLDIVVYDDIISKVGMIGGDEQ